VLAAGRGETVLSPTAATRLVGEVRAPAKVSLSQRELEVLTLIARGRTNKEVGAALYISEATVKSHLLHLYGKLGVNDRAAAVAAAFKADLLKLSPDQD
jgi:DNA-binding NarL/FixJ family response regulator